MGERDWAAEARERWPGCEASVNEHGELSVRIGREFRSASPMDGLYWCGAARASDPVSALVVGFEIDAARARAQIEAGRATLARLAVWGVA